MFFSFLQDSLKELFNHIRPLPFPLDLCLFTIISATRSNNKHHIVFFLLFSRSNNYFRLTQCALTTSNSSYSSCTLRVEHYRIMQQYCIFFCLLTWMHLLASSSYYSPSLCRNVRLLLCSFLCEYKQIQKFSGLCYAYFQIRLLSRRNIELSKSPSAFILLLLLQVMRIISFSSLQK